MGQLHRCVKIKPKHFPRTWSSSWHTRVLGLARRQVRVHAGGGELSDFQTGYITPILSLQLHRH